MSTTKSQQWLRILTKGMVTLPKVWRKELGLTDGMMVQAHKEDNKIIIELIKAVTPDQAVPYRIYSQDELDQMLEDDALSPIDTAKIDKKIQALRSA